MISVLTAKAQYQSVIDATEALKKGNFKKAEKKIKKGLSKDRKIYQLYYLQAWADLLKAKEEEELKRQLKGFEKAFKSFNTAITKDKENLHSKEYHFIAKMIAHEYRVEALELYRRDKFSSSKKILEPCVEIAHDTLSKIYLGLNLWQSRLQKDKAKGGAMLRESAELIHKCKLDSVQPELYIQPVFYELGNYYSSIDEDDSALIYIKLGLDVFPTDLILQKQAVQVITYKIQKIKKTYGNSSTILKWCEAGLQFEPNNELFLNSTNEFFIKALDYAFGRDDTKTAALIDSAFFATKQLQIANNSTNSGDAFLIEHRKNFVQLAINLFQQLNNHSGMVYYFKEWFQEKYDTTFTEYHADTLLNNPPKYIKGMLYYALINDAVKQYPKNQKIQLVRYRVYKKWVRGTIQYKHWDYILEWNKDLLKKYPKKKYELLSDKELLYGRAIDSFVNYGNIKVALDFFNTLKVEFPKNKNLDALQKNIAIKDFEVRYKSTAIGIDLINGKKIPLTGWNGSSQNCSVGVIPDTTNFKITQRINYFRQNAGVQNLVKLNEDIARKCQEASVMYSPVGIFTRKATPETHLCFSNEAYEASKFAQAIKENNPSIAATVLFADPKSDELYNRQYILAPNTHEFGYGASENNSVFWMVQPSDSLSDSSYYNNNFIAWPPAGYCPRMLTFDKWSFSTSGDLTNAKVTVKTSKGKNIPVKVSVEKAPMVAFSTLVMTPDNQSFNPKNFPSDEKVNITIQLKSKRKFSYSFGIFETNK